MMKIQKVTDASFRPYGRIVEGYDLKGLMDGMANTPCPDDVIYVASDAELEKLPIFKELSNGMYGGMPIEIGYCNGHNDLLNAVEYHRDSELNIAQTDAILIVGKLQDVNDDFTYDTSKMEAFLVPAGTLVEVYSTTLHYAPCGVDGEGFRVCIVLPRETNFDIVEKPNYAKEDRLLAARNKWLIAHEDAKIEGAFNGLRGENLSVR